MTCAIIGLIFGILAIFCFGLPFGIVATVLGVIGVSQDEKKPGQTVVSVVTIILGVVDIAVMLLGIFAVCMV